MADKYIAYPAVFTLLNNKLDSYFVKFPDLPNTFTEGHGLEDAYIMASDVLAEMNYDNNRLPEPSPIEDIKADDGQFVAIISANLSERARKDKRTVRKNLTLDADLVKLAEDAGINFSKTMNNALKERLGV